MEAFQAALGIITIIVAMSLLIRYLDGAKFFAPGTTDHLAGSAQTFCLDTCKLPGGRCPLEGKMTVAECPLWRFVESKISTDLRVDAFRPVGAKAPVATM
ncbi:MAG: hypothetical protein HY700_11295 [Gemmatimonadetes bacterium]|nr:hypothetical protein [Gemmatimonadota bacterium]